MHYVGFQWGLVGYQFKMCDKPVSAFRIRPPISKSLSHYLLFASWSKTDLIGGWKNAQHHYSTHFATMLRKQFCKLHAFVALFTVPQY